MLIKIHKSYRDVIAICDSELLGKKFKEGKMELDLTGEFFNGDDKTEEEILEIIQDSGKEDATFNIIGENSIKTGLKAEIIDEKGIKRVQGIPVALTLL
tara:strand:+ start:752 stop:1048 length:297 start_codon:yes stop_codon:yes gene_type:complete